MKPPIRTLLADLASVAALFGLLWLALVFTP